MKKYIFHYNKNIYEDLPKFAIDNMNAHDGMECYIKENKLNNINCDSLIEVWFDDGFSFNVYREELEEIKI